MVVLGGHPLRADGSTALSDEKLVALRVEHTDHVAEVTLIGPGKGNTMGPDFWRELPVVFGELDADPAVRAVVLTGEGDHFSYGLDLPAMMPSWSGLMTDGALAGSRTEFLQEVRWRRRRHRGRGRPAGLRRRPVQRPRGTGRHRCRPRQSAAARRGHRRGPPA